MFEFKFEENITKELILNNISEEQIFCYYLGIEKVSKKLICSRLRADKNPTCGFYRNRKGELYLHDFATGEFYNCISLVMALYKLSYHQALKVIANDFNIINFPNIEKNTGLYINKATKFVDKGMSKIQIEIKDFSQEELSYWNQFGISLETLKKFRVYSCKAVFLNDNLFSLLHYPQMAFGYYGGKLNEQELWRIYYPLNKEKGIRFLTNWPSKKIQGYEMLPKSGNLLVITKSMKDSMVLYEFGIPAIAPNSENLFISKTVMDKLKERFKLIVVLYDTDLAGITNMRKIKKEFPELIYTWIPRKYNTKDISDFYKNFGKQQTLNLITRFIKWAKHR